MPAPQRSSPRVLRPLHEFGSPCCFVAAIGTRVSFSNCTGCSSRHITGGCGSWATAAVSSTSSMQMTNSASCSIGPVNFLKGPILDLAFGQAVFWSVLRGSTSPADSEQSVFLHDRNADSFERCSCHLRMVTFLGRQQNTSADAVRQVRPQSCEPFQITNPIAAPVRRCNRVLWFSPGHSARCRIQYRAIWFTSGPQNGQRPSLDEWPFA